MQIDQKNKNDEKNIYMTKDKRLPK